MNTRTEPLDVPIRFRVTRSMAEFLDSQGNRSKVLQGLIEREMNTTRLPVEMYSKGPIYVAEAACDNLNRPKKAKAGEE